MGIPPLPIEEGVSYPRLIMNVNNTIIEHVEQDSSVLDSIIDKVVSESAGALEAYVDNIRKLLS